MADGPKIRPFNIDEETLRALERFAGGKDVRSVIAQILIQQDRRPPYQTRVGEHINLKELPINDLLTSELVQLTQGKPDESPNHWLELERRLKLLELTGEQQHKFVDIDLQALTSNPRHIIGVDIAPLHYIMTTTSVEDLPKPIHCSTSELIAIVEDARAAQARDHEWLPDSALEAMHVILTPGGQYEQEFQRRINVIGLQQWQYYSFAKSEQWLLARAKWGYDQRASWTPQTLVK